MKTWTRRAAVWIIILTAAVSVLLPSRALFTGGGFLAAYIGLPQSGRMLAEIGILCVLSGAIWFFPWSAGKQLLASALLAAAVCWLHVVFLPMLISALYMGFLLLLGRFLQHLFLRRERGRFAVHADVFLESGNSGGSQAPALLAASGSGWPAYFLLGSSAVIAVYCLLSAAGLGQISLLRFLCACAGVCLYAGAFRSFFLNKAFPDRKRIPSRRLHPLMRAGAAYILVMVLIQAARMNIALDFDTLWYGVRSEYILAAGKGMYENPGLVGMAYVYSKGFEVLTLPLCDLASHSYLLFFNLWLSVLGLGMTGRIARLFAGERAAALAAVCTAAAPGIMNMAVSAKPDIITWTLQLIMMERFFLYVKGGRRLLLFQAAGAFLLSLAMKPTSLVFSTALFGMMGVFLLGTGRLSLRAPASHWGILAVPAAALTGIWTRTMLITGMPVTSVFTGVLARLGFEMKYPFATGSLPQNWQEESNLHVLARRLFQMLLAPEGEDMGHVIIAWGSSLLFFLLICLALFSLRGCLAGLEKGVAGRAGGCFREKSAAENSGAALKLSFHVIAWPFLAVNLVSLVMLYQVDGNYFMMLYSLLILAACMAVGRVEEKELRRCFYAGLGLVLAFNVLITAETNWAWSCGFSEIRLLNKGRVNHRAMQQERLWAEGNAQIWLTLSADRENRVIAFGNHPFCLEFPCNVQSYKDITAPWGNVDLVESPESFEAYMEYAGTDYIYAQAGFIGPGSWEWSYGLLRQMIARGSLEELFFEEGNMLARVAGQKLSKEEALDNLAAFDTYYRTAGQREE